MSKKCIIIGSGLGGLSCGAILSKNGYDVTIMEQGAQIGGCLQCFNREGIKFETGMHFIGSADNGQTLNKLLRYLGIYEKLKLSRLDTERYNIISLKGERFEIASGKEQFIEKMSNYFPNEKGNIVKYYNLIESVAGASSLHSLKYEESDMTINTEFQLRSINDVLDTVTENETLKNVLAGDLPLYAAEKNVTPFSTHAFVMDFYNQSAFRIVGGSNKIGIALTEQIKKEGGKVLTNHKVVKIVCDNTKATGVEVDKKGFFAADIIISDTHPSITINMLDTKLIRPAFRQRVSSIRNTVSGFTVYLHFKKESMPYMNSNLFSYNTSSPWNCEQYNQNSWPKGFLYMHFCESDNQKFANAGVILSYMHYDEVKRWENTHIEERGDDYNEFKRIKAEILIERLERECRGTKACIENYYTSTPLTYRDYTGTPQGSMYGIAKDITIGSAGRIPHKTKVPNLLLTGQNINSHGMLGVIVGSIVTCSELLGTKEIYKQIINSNL
jgi:all-trans-retinol 13,14-reductase